jgi:ferredoxin/flavodoxin
MKINMFYFSGTGFTERVAKNLSAEFSALGHEAMLEYIPDALLAMKKAGKHKTDPEQDFDMLGILYPIHSFNAPEIVVKFARKLPQGKGQRAFIVKTAGGKSPLNSGSSDLLKKILSRKGYKVTYEEVIQMPANFIVRYEDEVIRQLITDAERLLKVIAEEIVKGRRKLFHPGFGVKAAARLGRVEWIGAHFIAKLHFKVSDSCNLCKICVRDCPTKNIRVENECIKFGANCTFCMRCIYACPQKAIHLRKPLGAIEVKDWFDLDELMGRK